LKGGFMRLFVTLLAIVLLLPLTVSAEPAKTIDELVAPYDSSKCAECHEEAHENWAKSWHAKSVTDPRVLRAWRTFIIQGLDASPQAKRSDLKHICFSCHAPVTKKVEITDALTEQIADLIITAAEDKDAAKRDAATKELGKLNIGCLACHNIDGSPDGNPKPNTIYGPGDAEDPPHKEEFGFETVKAPFMKTAGFCKNCHHGCPPDMPSSICPTLWSSYEEEYLAHGGDKTCQECHMQGEDGANHRFPGIYEKDFTATGVDLKLSASATEYVDYFKNRVHPTVVMNVQLKNTSGHGIPHG
jgi:hypothetical protein